MVYIIILNWKGAEDTISCINSLFKLKGSKFRIVICDNQSTDDSYINIRDWLISQQKIASSYMTTHSLVELDNNRSQNYIIPHNEQSVYLIQTGDNLGYAGGNNVGIRLAMNQPDMEYVWILNNDTEVEPDSLFQLVKRCKSDPKIGICGSRLVYYHERNKLQGLGGIYNPWLCTTKHYAAFCDSNLEFDDVEVAEKIDYIIGASMLLTRSLLEKIGLLCEDYFLYYEEIDLALRAGKMFSLGVASKSIVYHKEGASMEGGRRLLSDYYAVRNKIIITRKFHKKLSFLIKISFILLIVNRLRRFEMKKAFNVFKLMVY